jgi:hypothetical protein
MDNSTALAICGALKGIEKSLDQIANALETYNNAAIQTYVIDRQKETGVVIFTRTITPTS